MRCPSTPADGVGGGGARIGARVVVQHRSSHSLMSRDVGSATANGGKCASVNWHEFDTDCSGIAFVPPDSINTHRVHRAQTALRMQSHTVSRSPMCRSPALVARTLRASRRGGGLMVPAVEWTPWGRNVADTNGGTAVDLWHAPCVMGSPRALSRSQRPAHDQPAAVFSPALVFSSVVQPPREPDHFEAPCPREEIRNTNVRRRRLSQTCVQPSAQVNHGQKFSCAFPVRTNFRDNQRVPLGNPPRASRPWERLHLRALRGRQWRARREGA